MNFAKCLDRIEMEEEDWIEAIMSLDNFSNEAQKGRETAGLIYLPFSRSSIVDHLLVHKASGPAPPPNLASEHLPFTKILPHPC